MSAIFALRRIICFFAACFFIPKGAYDLALGCEFYWASLPGTGNVTGISYTEEKDGSLSYHLDYSYTTLGGKTGTGGGWIDGKEYAAAPIHDGYPVKIDYLIFEPTISELAGSSSHMEEGIGMTFFGSFLMVYAASGFAFVRRAILFTSPFRFLHR